MSAKARNPFGPDARHDAGVTATLTDGARATTVVVRAAGTLEALREVCDLCDRFGLAIVVVSTPGTIVGDLLGRLRRGRHGDGGAYVESPEAQLLGQIGRRDLLWKGP